MLLIAQQKPKKALKAIELIYRNNSQYEQWLQRDLFFGGSCLADSPKGMGVKDKDDLITKILTKLVNLEIKDKALVGRKVSQQVFSIIVSLAETDWEIKVLNLLKEEKDKIEQFRFLSYQSQLGEKEKAISILFSLLQDKDSYVRSSAIDALVKLGEGSTNVTTSITNWLEENSDTKYVANGIDVLWDAVVIPILVQ